jgi:hypothetical protein
LSPWRGASLGPRAAAEGRGAHLRPPWCLPGKGLRVRGEASRASLMCAKPWRVSYKGGTVAPPPTCVQVIFVTARVAYNAAFRVRVISRHLEHCLMRLCVYVIRTVEKERFRARFGSLFARKHPVTR